MKSSDSASTNQAQAKPSHDGIDKIQQILSRLKGRPIVLIGMMGAGKTTVGRRLAARLNRDFIDSDAEIETAAGMQIADIFNIHGEPEFRAGETRVISRILKQSNIILGTGGGAFMGARTRELIKAMALSVWLKAEFDLLFARVSRRSNRPLLHTPNPRKTLHNLMTERYPTYAEADITVTSRDVPHEIVANQIIDQLHDFLTNERSNADDT